MSSRNVSVILNTCTIQGQRYIKHDNIEKSQIVELPELSNACNACVPTPLMHIYRSFRTNQTLMRGKNRTKHLETE